MSLEPNPAGKLFPQILRVGATPDWRSIGLTSPYTQGHEVVEAQYLLSHNRWDEDYKPGKLDGIFGPRTAHAVMQAKYWMGYKHNSPDWEPVFGSRLRGYLLPKTHAFSTGLSVPNAIRRQNRILALNRQEADAVYLKAFHIAMSQVGYSGEGQAGICSKYATWYGLPCSNWCAEFVSYCIVHAGGTLRESYVPTIVQKAELRIGKLSIAPEPYRGCLVVFDWTGDGIWDHIEFFDEYVDHEHLGFMTVGGNTGEVGGQNGGQVLHSARSTAIRHIFINYTIRHPA